MPTVAEVLAEGLAHHRAGRWADARRIYRRVLAFDHAQPDALRLLGALELEAGSAELAAGFLGQAVTAAPDDAAVQANLGRALRRQGDSAGAERALRRSLAREPEVAAVWLDLGFAAAFADGFGRALAIEPHAVDALNNRATHLYGRGEPAAAARLLRRALVLQPAGSGLWQNLGLVFRGTGGLMPAIAALGRSAVLEPGNATAFEALGWTRHLAGDAPGAAADYRRALGIDPDRADVHANLILTLNCLSDVGPEAILAEQRNWDARFARPLAGPPAVTLRDPERRLRVGYLAVEGFRAHTAAVTLLPLIEGHDRQVVEVVCYSDVDPARADNVTRRFRELADRWCDAGDLDDAALAERVRADRIDVLADLYGYPPGSRLLTLARRPAPVQVNLLPMGSFGLDAVPWMVGDDRLTPAGSESWFRESVVRLPLAFCYWPLRAATSVGPGPALRGGPVVFGSFNQPAKLSDRSLGLWARILAALPAARLVLKGMAFADPPARAAFLRRAASAGLDPGRVDALPWISDGTEHLSAYGDIDIALDPTPYAGVITTCEALSLGVPVVTRAGDRLLGRYGATLLHAVGLPELVAESDDAYVEAAVALAQDRTRLAALRATLGRRFAESPICDAKAYARSIEAAYRQMWRSWCRST
ncbi:MAG: tetratricopeptide repeat protein [Alphaproteobacteria bacterium]|nr:tetratricopeptide repeat protein [Alphaproteobacteria bacterium]